MMKYSIIIPVYNCAEYLEKCVSSVRNQMGENVEILLIDDGTPDDSGKIADQLASACSRISVFHKGNGGAASARNVGIEKATGEYLIFLDGDDTVAEDFFSFIEKNEENAPSDMAVYGISFDFYRSGTLQKSQILSCKHCGKVEIQMILDNFQEYFEDNALSSACNKVFRSDIIEKHQLRFQEGMTLYEDMDFVLRYMKYIKEISFINQPLYHYRHDLDHLHINNRTRNLEQLQENMIRLLSSIDSLAGNCADVSVEVYATGIDLALQLLSRHMSDNVFDERDVKAYVQLLKEKTYWNNQKITLTKRNEWLLEQIESGKFDVIRRSFRKHKHKAKVKKLIKKIIGRA